MSSSTGISELYGEFTDTLTEVLAVENAVEPAHRGSRTSDTACLASYTFSI